MRILSGTVKRNKLTATRANQVRKGEESYNNAKH